jgi:serine/threonine-protein kinase
LADRPYVLLDLGIAYNVTEPGLTIRADHIPHTPLYLAPEMVDSNFRETLSYRADLYAAGISAFEFATGGIHPLAKKGENLGKTYHRILNQEPTFLATLRPDLPAELCGLIDQLLKKKPALRPGNFALVLSQLA